MLIAPSYDFVKYTVALSYFICSNSKKIFKIFLTSRILLDIRLANNRYSLLHPVVIRGLTLIAAVSSQKGRWTPPTQECASAEPVQC
jgi:hypothetical protein